MRTTVLVMNTFDRLDFPIHAYALHLLALCQLRPLHMLQAKKYIPDAFKLVDFGGWTLGGFYLARYNDSPVGAFDEV